MATDGRDNSLIPHLVALVQGGHMPTHFLRTRLLLVGVRGLLGCGGSAVPMHHTQGPPATRLVFPRMAVAHG